MSNLDLPSQFDTPDNTSAGLDAAVLIVRDTLGHQVITAQSGQTVNFTAVQGQHYRLLSNTGDSEEQLLDNLISVRQGADLIVTYAQGAQVTINGYFDLCVPVTAEQPDDLQCSATVAGDTEAGYVIRGAADSAGVGANSPQIVYTHGEEQELLALVNGNATDEILLTTYLAGIVEPAAAAAFGLPGILGGLGAAAAAAAGGGGSSEGEGTASAPVANNPGKIAAITGNLFQGQTLTAGKISDLDGLPTNGSIKYQWKADGTDIAGATGNTYILMQAEVGKVITVVAIYSDGGNKEETVTSVPTAVITQTEAQAAATLKSIKDAAQDNTADDLTLDFFTALGFDNITNGNPDEGEVGLDSIKSALNSIPVNGAAVDTLGKLQGVVDSYLAILQAANGDTTTDPTKISEADFTKIGVDMTSEALESKESFVAFLIDAVGMSEHSGVDRVPALQALANAVNGVMFGAAGVEGKPTLADLKILSLLGVEGFFHEEDLLGHLPTLDNLAAIQQTLANSIGDGNGKETLKFFFNEIGLAIFHYNNAIYEFNQLATLDEIVLVEVEGFGYVFGKQELYHAIGIVGAGNHNLDLINAILREDTVKAFGLDTYFEIQDFVNHFNIIQAFADDNQSEKPSLDNFEAIGIIGVTEDNLEAVLESSLANSFNEGTYAHIQNFVTSFNIIQTFANNGDSAENVTGVSKEDFENIGITKVTEDNLGSVLYGVSMMLVNENNQPKDPTNIEVLQNQVNGSVMMHAIAVKAISLLDFEEFKDLELEIFMAAGVVGVVDGDDETNLAGINALLKQDNLDDEKTNTTAKIQAVVDGYNAIMAAVNSDEAPLINLKHYEAVGVFGVDTVVEGALMGDVISNLESAEGFGQTELQALANAVQHVMDTADGTAQANGTELTNEDLFYLGITTQNLAFLVEAIANTNDNGTQVDSVSEIQNLTGAKNARLGVNITDLVTLSGDSFDFSDVAKTTGEVYTPEAAYTVSDQTMTRESYDVYLADNKAAELWHNPEIAVVI